MNSSSKRFAGIVFDLDGVLVDSRPVLETAVRQAIHDVGVPWHDAMLEVVFRDHRAVFSNTYPRHPHLLRRFHVSYSGNPIHAQVVLLPYAKETLSKLKSLGIALALATTKDFVRTRKILDGFSLVFDHVVTSDDTATTRPDPEPLLRALSGIEVTRSAALYVGDTPLDIEQSRNAALPCVAVATGAYSARELATHAPECVVDDLRQLAQFVERSNGV